MVSVAAGLARWACAPGYTASRRSCTPPLRADPQRRLPDGLPVVLWSERRGLRYGVMGGTHHALEDYGALLRSAEHDAPSFPPSPGRPRHHRPVEVASASGVSAPRPRRVAQGRSVSRPMLRGGVCSAGGGPVLVLSARWSGGILEAAAALAEAARPSVWVLTECRSTRHAARRIPWPICAAPGTSSWSRNTSLRAAPARLAHALLRRGTSRRGSRIGGARLLSGLYGSQSFHRQESGLDPESIAAEPMRDASCEDPRARKAKIRQLQGPILVLGASGFVGANLMRALLAHRATTCTDDVTPAWRLEELPEENVCEADLLVDANVDPLLDEVRPRTIFNCVAYGAYSFETDSELIYRDELHPHRRLLERLQKRPISPLRPRGQLLGIRRQCRRPRRGRLPRPTATTRSRRSPARNLIHYYGKKKGPLRESSPVLRLRPARGSPRG